MGAGRIVIQELKRIDDGLSTGELFKAKKWKELVKQLEGTPKPSSFVRFAPG